MFEINQLNCCYYLSSQARKLNRSDVYHFSVAVRQREVHSQPSVEIFLIRSRIKTHGSRRRCIFIEAVLMMWLIQWVCSSRPSLSASTPANGRYLLRKSTRSCRYDKWGTDADKPSPSRRRRRSRKAEHTNTHRLTWSEHNRQRC